MKNYLTLFAITCLIAFTSCSASKELTAELTSTRSSLNDCQEELSAAKNELMSTKQALADAKAMSGNNTGLIDELRAENNALKNQLTIAQSDLVKMTQKMQETSDDFGVWFRVQIGAYENRHIDQRLETTDELSLEERNELQKIALGRFRNYDDAKQLQSQLQEMGLKDAWVVSYKDGERVPIETVK